MAKIKARVLVDCAHGKCGDVVEVDADLVKTTPELDADKAAVAYAEAELKRKAEAAAKAAEGN
jgi:hypothetical protein